jgi:hypothetical protein
MDPTDWALAVDSADLPDPADSPAYPADSAAYLVDLPDPAALSDLSACPPDWAELPDLVD